MPAINNDEFAFLDKAAYNRPDVLPLNMTRCDRAPHRLYFRFMCCIYMLYKNNILGKDELTGIKNKFTEDLKLYDLYFRAAIKSEREFQRLDSAMTDCRKNADNCAFCKNISMIHGAPERADEPDIHSGQ